MYQIDSLSSDPLQQQNIILPDGTSLFLQIYYIQQQYGWFITSLTYNTFAISGVRITSNPNILHQFKNLIPFGLACFTTGNREPTQLTDFSTGASALYVLTSDEVAEYTAFLTNG